MDVITIMNLVPGPELDKPVEEALSEYVDIDYGCDNGKGLITPWSTNEREALQLWGYIEDVTHVGILRMGLDSPIIISQLATLGEEGDTVFVFTSSWMESLCKAFLLYEHGHRGDFMHPEWEQKKNEAPKRLRRVK